VDSEQSVEPEARSPERAVSGSSDSGGDSQQSDPPKAPFRRIGSDQPQRKGLLQRRLLMQNLPKVETQQNCKKSCCEALGERDYRLLGAVSRGANPSFVVRQATKDGRTMAVKCLDEPRGSGCLRRTLEREHHILSRLQHPNIMEVTDFVDFDSGCMSIREFCPGFMLTQGLTKDVWSTPDRHSIAIHILDAVAYLHELKIAHRDLHPDNVMVREGEAAQAGVLGTPVVKLIDFGSARHHEHDAETSFNDTWFIDDVNVKILPLESSSRRSDMFSCDLFAIGLLILGLVNRRVVFTSSIFDGDLLKLGSLRTRSVEVDDYLRSLLGRGSPPASTARDALNNVPAVGKWPTASAHLASL